MAKEVIFEAKHMRKEFGPTIALKDVNFELRRGEIRGLVGENGSGKSTIMSIASGMQPATSGEMFYKGEPWHPHTMAFRTAFCVMFFLSGLHNIWQLDLGRPVNCHAEGAHIACRKQKADRRPRRTHDLKKEENQDSLAYLSNCG